MKRMNLFLLVGAITLILVPSSNVHGVDIGAYHPFGGISYNQAIQAEIKAREEMIKIAAPAAKGCPEAEKCLSTAKEQCKEGNKKLNDRDSKRQDYLDAVDLFNQCYESAKKAEEIGAQCSTNESTAPSPPKPAAEPAPPNATSPESAFVPVSLASCGAINDIVEDATHIGTLYAASSACGVLKSGNGGKSWDKTGLAQGNVVRVFGVDGAVLALVADKGLMVSKDGGANWTAVTAPEAGLTYTCGCIPGAGVVYLGTNAGLFASADGGKTWQLITARGDGVRWVSCGKDPRKVVAVFASGRVSACSGDWSQWADLGSDPANQRVFLVYLQDLAYFLARQDGQLLRCNNPSACASGGWAPVAGITGAASWVSCMDKDCKCLGVLTAAGLHRSCDGGKTFEFIRSTEMNKPEVFAPLSDGTVILGGEGEIRRPAKIEEKKSLGDVNFETGKADLTGEAKATLDGMVAKLASRSELRVRVEGHTDNVGGDDYNLDLSQRRADSVKSYLISKGIAAERFETKGYGKQFPIAGNDTAEGKAKNRRVEVYILD
jgi:outer membrane protein OmpA-like peptidoglycan-associated protein